MKLYYPSYFRSLSPLTVVVLCAFHLLVSCHQIMIPDVPKDHWEIFTSPEALPLHEEWRKNLEGVYVVEGSEDFGSEAALKWTYTLAGQDTTYHLSVFLEKDAAYFICEGKRLDQKILLNGYWRKMVNTQTGLVRLILDVGNNASLTKDSGKTVMKGSFGKGDAEPDKSIRLRYNRPLYSQQPMEIIGHRGGGRVSDLLPASENTVELIRMASRLGATGVEIDVQSTSDGIPVLYHDAHINDRLTHKTGIRGALKDYRYTELAGDVRLKNGERIPTLEQALDTIIHHTPLRYIWLDVKDSLTLPLTLKLQSAALQKAASLGREIEITIGIHDESVYNRFLLLPDFKSIPSLCELDPEYATTINARIWAPLWTEGLQKEKLMKVHAEGRRAFVWTVDQPKQILKFMKEGGYDGLVSNYPSLVAFYYYSQQPSFGTQRRSAAK